jgi:hypothetical protein
MSRSVRGHSRLGRDSRKADNLRCAAESGSNFRAFSDITTGTYWAGSPSTAARELLSTGIAPPRADAVTGYEPRLCLAY